MKNSKTPNRLINEKSPYLLQHAYNPVDWYPWGEEAFQKARNDDKPIFLSVGYSTCYWCHVMEREVFSEAIKNKTASVIFVHNHRSGDPEPSEDDLLLTKKLVDCGKILSIEVADQIIVAKDNIFIFKNKGLI